MSWVSEEWKTDLPSNVLKKISELEDDREKLVKEKKCLHFQNESLQATLDNLRESSKKQKQENERTLASFISELDETKLGLEKAKLALKEKDVTVVKLTNELACAKKERDTEKELRLEKEKESERLSKELTISQAALLRSQTELLNAREGMQEIISKEDKSELLRLKEENTKLKEERQLERLERERIDTKFDNIDVDDELLSQIQDLQKCLTEREKEVQELRDKFGELGYEVKAKDSKSETVTCRSSLSTSKMSSFDIVGSDRETEEFVRDISTMKSQIFELEQENNNLRAEVSDHKARVETEQHVSEYEADSIRESLTELGGQLEISEKAREDIAKQLRDERETFMASENGMRQEIACLREEMERCKTHWQEEREGFMEQERHMRDTILQLKEGSNAEDAARIKSLVAEKKDLNETVAVLGNKIDDLERMKANLEKENTDLTANIRKEKDHCSDVEETMKDDIDSIRSCLQDKISQLESANRELQSKYNVATVLNKGSGELQRQVTELYTELDAVNKILANERDKRKKVEEENFELKKRERAFENVFAATSQGDERGLISSSAKRRGERWAADAIELRKKVDELEKKNRELTNTLDRRACSVEALRQGYESKSRDQLRKGPKSYATPDRPGSSNDIPRLNTPLSRRFETVSSLPNTPQQFEVALHSKEEKIAQLNEKVQSIKQDRVDQGKKYEAKVKALQDEITLLRQHIEGVSSVSKPVHKTRSVKGLQTTIVQESQREVSTTTDSGLGTQNIAPASSSKSDSIDELKILVTEFEKESSELQEIIDESKDAIIELKKALQGNDGLFLVDSANVEEIKKLASLSLSDIDETDNKASLKRSHIDVPSEKQSYVLSRLSLTDVDVDGVLSKLRIAVSQLESRLQKVLNEKEMARTKLEEIKKNPRSHLASSSAGELRSGPASSKSSFADIAMTVSRSAVMDIARARDATIIDGTIDDIAHEENIRPREDKNFQHGPRCKLLWQQLCDARASLSGYEREVIRQKGLYEKHLAECQEAEQQAEGEAKCKQNENKVDKKELQKQEQYIADLQSELRDERDNSQRLQEEVDKCRYELEESQDSNTKLGEKLEETRSLLYKHHKSNEKKLDTITSFVQEGLIEQLKGLMECSSRRVEYARSSPSELKPLGHSGSSSKPGSNNTSFYSPDANMQAEITAKKSRSRRGKAMESQMYRTASHGYHTIDELENLKGRLNSVQEHVKSLVASVDQAQREKGKLQEECVRLMHRLEQKEEEMKKVHSNLVLEQRKTRDNETDYKAEMEALQAEQLEVFKEFREICETVKRKDVELLNKTKQLKLLTAEWKEKEHGLKAQIEELQRENKMVWTENNELRVEAERAKNVTEGIARKMASSEEQLGKLYQRLTNVDNMFFECRQKAMYK